MGYVTKHDWFTTPEKSSDDTILLRFLDHHHLLTNCRIHCCRYGFKALNINSCAWLKVAKSSKSNGTGLNVAYVGDLVDSQSNLDAHLTFSKDVENEMIKNKYALEANFCRLIREWYEAVDEKGLSANERVRKLLNLREFLLDSCQKCLRQFPPPGSHVCDIPVVLFTGLNTSCERLIQLYRLSKTGTYNVRSIGSLDNETFFSSYRDLDPRVLLCLRHLKSLKP
ncbi:unnamed protein product [Mytilus coruscus]|uniref:Uncharacterized protein n=1 Tax=Mytilus coruscus TaxID=42192 RepID=A0A6J8CMD3_MYTCO|nr:unnamed protein product [Mytilus coruscus]